MGYILCSTLSKLTGNALSKGPILDFFQLVIEVFFNPTLDVVYKQNRFSETFF